MSQLIRSLRRMARRGPPRLSEARLDRLYGIFRAHPNDWRRRMSVQERRAFTRMRANARAQAQAAVDALRHENVLQANAMYDDYLRRRRAHIRQRRNLRPIDVYAQPQAHARRRPRVRRIRPEHGAQWQFLPSQQNNFDEYVKYYLYNVAARGHNRSGKLYEFLGQKFRNSKFYSLKTKRWRKY